MRSFAVNRWAQWVLGLAIFFVGIVITIIVISSLTKQPSEIVKERKVIEEIPSQISLGDYASQEGETLEEFMRRVGRVLHNFTRESGNEACGPIASDGVRYSVRLHTDGVPHGCAMRASDVLDGYAWTGETIHSHPWQKLLRLDSHAQAWSKRYGDGNHGSPTLRNDGASGFSRADYVGGPGWLVAKGQLLYQAGQGKTTRHGPLSD